MSPKSLTRICHQGSRAWIWRTQWAFLHIISLSLISTNMLMKANQPVKLFLKEETYISSKPNAHPLTLEGYRNPKGLATHTGTHKYDNNNNYWSCPSVISWWSMDGNINFECSTRGRDGIGQPKGTSMLRRESNWNFKFQKWLQLYSDFSEGEGGHGLVCEFLGR